MANLKNLTINDTGFIELFSGDFSQRPLNPLSGMIKFNTEIGVLEYYDGFTWRDAVSGNELLGVINFIGQSIAPNSFVVNNTNVGNLSYDFSPTDGFRTAGDANNNAYPLQTENSFAGDMLFQASVLVTDSCSDPGLAIFPATSRTTAIWNWGSEPSRIAVQCNCPTPYIYGKNTSSNNGTISFGSNTYITMHFFHKPSVNESTFRVTQGKDDWFLQSTEVGTPRTINESYLEPVYLGVSSDFDGASLSSTSTNFNALRITPL
jgi:hypothetical protein